VSERFWTAPEDGSFLAAAGWTSIAAVFEHQVGERLDKQGLASWRQRWRVRLVGSPTEDEARTFYLKRFEHPPWTVQLARLRRGFWRTSTGGIEWLNARRLSDAGIACARAAAFGEQMVGPVERRSFVLLAEVPGRSLERWVPAAVPPPREESDRRGRRALLDALARFVGRFHAAGFVHRDLYLCHVFLTAADSTGYPDLRADPEPFALIDLQRVFQPRFRKRRWVVKDLAALAYSAPADRISRWERLRFLCRYVRVCSRFGSTRQLARRVGARTERLVRRLGPIHAGPFRPGRPTAE